MPNEVEKELWYLFIEDPGAVNYFIPLLEALEASGIKYKLFADGIGFTVFMEKGVRPIRPDNISRLFLDEKPTLVIVGTSENTNTAGLDFIRTAKQHGIKSVGLVDSGVNAKHRFRGNTNDPLAFGPDFLFVPDEWSVTEFKNLGFSHENITTIGHPVFNSKQILEPRDKVRARVLPTIAQASFVIVFVSEISDGLDSTQYLKGDDYTLHGRGTRTKRTEIVVEELLDSVKIAFKNSMLKPFLILRRHPKEKENDLGALCSEFDYVSADEDAKDLVYAADLVVGMTSMLLNEAHWLDRPCLSVVPRIEEKDWLPVTRSGEVECVSDRINLIGRVSHLISEASMSGIGASRRHKVTEEHFSAFKCALLLQNIS